MLQHETIFTCLSHGHIGKPFKGSILKVFISTTWQVTDNFMSLCSTWVAFDRVSMQYYWGGLCSKKLVFVGLHERPRDVAFHVIWLCGRILCTHCGGYCLRSSGSRTTYAHTETSDLSRCRSHVAQNYSHFDISEVYLHKSCHLFLGVDIWIANVYKVY